jgi:hypothetical protein
VIAGLRAANARLRELLAERDEHIARLQAGELQVLWRSCGAGRGPGGAGRAELEELQQAAIVRWPGQAVAQVAAEQDRPQAGPSQAPDSLGLARPNPVTVPSQVHISISFDPQYQREWLGQYPYRRTRTGWSGGR